jgi:hypothetical protein
MLVILVESFYCVILERTLFEICIVHTTLQDLDVPPCSSGRRHVTKPVIPGC